MTKKQSGCFFWNTVYNYFINFEPVLLGAPLPLMVP